MREILPGVIHWTAKHPNLGLEVSSYWLVPERTVLNPLLPPGGLRAFGAEPPEHVVLTNRHHYRDSERFDGARVFAPRVGLHEFTPGQRVRGYDDGDEVVPGIRAHAIGELSPDEFALVIPRAKAVALADGAVRFGDRPLHFVPDNLIGDDPEAVKTGLKREFAKLAEDEDFDALLLAHGDPLPTGGREALLAFAESA